jgi:hypothetical protein
MIAGIRPVTLGPNEPVTAMDRMAAFPKPHAWSTYLRRALLALPPADAALLALELQPLMRPRVEAAPTYPTRSQAAIR